MQIDDNQLIVTDVVASGGFGTVYKGALGWIVDDEATWWAALPTICMQIHAVQSCIFWDK